jgi:hypothetical protein
MIAPQFLVSRLKKLDRRRAAKRLQPEPMARIDVPIASRTTISVQYPVGWAN